MSSAPSLSDASPRASFLCVDSETLGERIRLNSPKALPCTAPYSMGDKACEPRGGRGANRGWDEGA